MEKILEAYTTKELVEELSRRKGVESTQIEPYEKYDMRITGPAIILVVID